jgi:hypothetical protein
MHASRVACTGPIVTVQSPVTESPQLNFTGKGPYQIAHLSLVCKWLLYCTVQQFAEHMTADSRGRDLSVHIITISFFFLGSDFSMKFFPKIFGI